MVGLLLPAAAGTAAAQAGRAHKIVIHIGGADPALMSTALHNAANAFDAYAAKNEVARIELVANGPGYTMVRADTSPVAALFAAIRKKYPEIVLSTCQMSRKAAAAAEGKSVEQIPQLPGVTDVPAGIVRLTELQEQGSSYIRV
jgi:intracellular sulfur oxidation DsrE/DsrF family protein